MSTLKLDVLESPFLSVFLRGDSIRIPSRALNKVKRISRESVNIFVSDDEVK